MKISLVIGSGGLFGNAIKNILDIYGKSSFEIPEPFIWNEPKLLHTQFRRNISQYLTTCQNSQEWQIIWAAGKATMRSDAAEAELETANFASFLNILGEELTHFKFPGKFGFCSSAGSIYAGCQTELVTDQTLEAPTTPYAQNKIQQEKILTDWANQNENCQRILIGRLSNLYGPLQDVQKKQGLISHMADCLLHNQEIQIFVPLNTRRDYIWSDDAAKIYMHLLNEDRDTKNKDTHIIAQEESASIEEIIAAFQEITGLNPKISNTVDSLSAAYPKSIQFKGSYSLPEGFNNKLSLREGIQKVWDAKNHAKL
jgi:UDP-glucose 4-epimerase